MIRWTEVFVGRDNELERLEKAWAAVQGGGPRVVALVSEPGLGKTRLIQAFYERVMAGAAKEGNAYWPSTLPRVGNNLDLNPPPAACGVEDQDASFLWWAARVPDPRRRNQSSSGALRAAEPYLRDHLSGYEKARQLEENWRDFVWSGASGMADIAIALLGTSPDIGRYAEMAGDSKSVFHLVRHFAAYHTRLSQIADQPFLPADVAARRETDMVNGIINDLRIVCHSPTAGIKPLPLLFIIDDVQWLPEDETLSRLVSQLLRAAAKEGWPLLMLVSAWRQEWQGLTADVALARCFKGQGVPVEVIDLTPEPTLGSVVQTAFPGLRPAQQALIVDRADGHPGFLDELLRLLESRPALFKDRSLGNYILDVPRQ